MWSSTISTSATVLMISRCPGDQTRNDCNQVSVRAASESQREREAVREVARENLLQERLQQMERDMVRDLQKEKTLGGD